VALGRALHAGRRCEALLLGSLSLDENAQRMHAASFHASATQYALLFFFAL